MENMAHILLYFCCPQWFWVRDIAETCYASNGKTPAVDVIPDSLLKQSIDIVIGDIVGIKSML